MYSAPRQVDQDDVRVLPGAVEQDALAIGRNVEVLDGEARLKVSSLTQLAIV